jgi:hypothetical protein
MFAIETGSAITWGDLLIILAVIALILLILGFIRR